jgi:hypothetical protein
MEIRRFPLVRARRQAGGKSKGARMIEVLFGAWREAAPLMGIAAIASAVVLTGFRRSN